MTEDRSTRDSLWPQRLDRSPYWYYISNGGWLFACAVMALLVTNVADVLTTLALKWGVDAVASQSRTELANAALLYLALMAVCTLGRYGWRRLWPRFWIWAATDLRARAISKMLRLGPSFHQQRSSGELLSLVTNDVQTFKTGVGSGLLLLIDTLAYIVLIIPLMLSISWVWTVQVLLLFPILPPFVNWMTRRIRELSTHQSERLSIVTGVAQEIVVGNRAIRASAAEDAQSQRFEVQSKRYEESVLRLTRTDAFLEPTLEFFVSLGAVTLLWFCSTDVIRGELTLGALVAFHDLLRRLIWPVEGLALALSFIHQGRAAHLRIGDLIRSSSAADISSQRLSDTAQLAFRELRIEAGQIGPELASEHSLHNLILQNLNLRVCAGQRIAIVGPVGAGKSVLFSTLLGLHPLRGGKILLNDENIAEWSVEDRAQHFILVPQESPLFSDTLINNLALGSKLLIADARLKELAALVCIEEEIESMPHGYESRVGERGLNLSGGQKQRLALARALARAEAVGNGLLLLDDCLSAVDQKTEKRILAGLDRWLASRPGFAVLYATHRPESLLGFHKTLRLEQGQMV